MKAWPVIAALALVGCSGQSASNASRDGQLIEEAKALETRANDQVNETVAKIEAENKAAMDEIMPAEPAALSNDGESDANQN